MAVCESLKALPAGVLTQCDTYFEAPHGRLKLRETDGEVAQLIAYQRPDHSAHRLSRYRIAEIDDAAGVRQALEEALGLKAVVRKVRRLFLLGNVRIHLDEVEGLGSFIEFEAVLAEGSDPSREEGRARELQTAFGIAEADIIGGSYCDLVSEAGR